MPSKDEQLKSVLAEICAIAEQSGFLFVGTLAYVDDAATHTHKHRQLLKAQVRCSNVGEMFTPHLVVQVIDHIGRGLRDLREDAVKEAKKQNRKAGIKAAV